MAFVSGNTPTRTWSGVSALTLQIRPRTTPDNKDLIVSTECYLYTETVRFEDLGANGFRQLDALPSSTLTPAQEEKVLATAITGAKAPTTIREALELLTTALNTVTVGAL